MAEMIETGGCLNESSPAAVNFWSSFFTFVVSVLKFILFIQELEVVFVIFKPVDHATLLFSLLAWIHLKLLETQQT